MGATIPNLKKARKNADITTQQAFADKLGVSVDTVSKWEQGVNVPGIETLIKIADICKCDTDYLLGRIDGETHDLCFVQDYTGLSKEAIECLRSFNKEQLSFVNQLITRKSVITKDGESAVRFLTFYSMLIRDQKALSDPHNMNAQLQIAGMQHNVLFEMESFIRELWGEGLKDGKHKEN